MSEIKFEGGQERREKPKRTILEIGVGSHPHYKGFILGKPLFNSEDRYIAFDITEERLGLFSKKPVYPEGK